MSGHRTVVITRAETTDDFDAARGLLQEYAEWLGAHLSARAFEAEMASLDRMYGPPRGSLLLATVDGEHAGCAGVRALRAAGEGVCEMKRLYVRPAYRGLGLGRRLAAAVVEDGRRLGYARMVLDTLDTMREAQAIYRALGFRDVPPYYENPPEGVRHMAAEL